jgi:DNA excision repair protein ERCC-5
VTEIGRQERIATNLNNLICNEAQELIALFGLPFVVAPMEAEAQCAMLDLLSLTNGIYFEIKPCIFLTRRLF